MKAKINSMESTIEKLAEEYYSMVSNDYHKDKDCHFFISTEWSYGRPAVYRAHHHGYIATEAADKTFASYEEACHYMIDYISDLLKERKAVMEDN